MDGDQPTIVPDLVGFGAAQACEAARQAGLIPYGPEFSAEPVDGTIVRQEPAAGATAAPAAPVLLWAEMGPGFLGDPTGGTVIEAEPEPVGV